LRLQKVLLVRVLCLGGAGRFVLILNCIWPGRFVGRFFALVYVGAY